MSKTRVVSQDIGDASVLPADLDVSADNTTSDATTGHHGLLLKLGGGSTNYLRADGTWNTPPGTGGSGSVATDAIWDAAGDLAVGTGADTAAKLTLGAAGGAVSRVNGAVAWNSGTSFPTAATGDRYWRTDLRLEFFYDGTRWLTTTLYRESLENQVVFPITTTPVVAGILPMWHTTYDLWVETCYLATYVATTNDGSKFWTVQLNKRDVTDAATSLGSVTTAADTVNNNVTHVITVNASVVQGTYKDIGLTVTKTSTPGGIYPNASLAYRLIGT